MGLTACYGTVDFMKEALHADFSEKTFLMLGKQKVYDATKADIFVMAKKLGVKLNYKKLRNTPPHLGGMTDSYSIFESLGFREVHAMDVSEYENADIIFDLNSRKLPSQLKNRFDYILDGGTTEHVFDYPQALKNIAEMLKIGGKIFHYTPTYSWTNHGYYSISPSLFVDFYESNGFQIENVDIVFSKKSVDTENSLTNFLASIPDYRIYNRRDPEDLEGYSGILRCIATKIHEVENIVNPQQTHWYGLPRMDWLEEVLIADSHLEDDAPCIGILGVDNGAQLVIDILKAHSSFKNHKVKAFFVGDNSNAPVLFNNYPIVNLDKILSFGIKNFILPTLDERIYANLIQLESANINVVSFTDYKPILRQQ